MQIPRNASSDREVERPAPSSAEDNADPLLPVADPFILNAASSRDNNWELGGAAAYLQHVGRTVGGLY